MGRGDNFLTSVPGECGSRCFARTSHVITDQEDSMRFGVYFYPWYNEQRWGEAPRRHTPLIGEYDSRHPSVINWQMRLMEWCGLDYVVFEFVPLEDWCFSVVAEATGRAIENLKKRSLKWTFLLDATFHPEHAHEVSQLMEMMNFVKSQGWLDGLPAGTSGKPLIFVFAPYPEHARTLTEAWTEFEVRFPTFLIHWDKVDEAFDLPCYPKFVDEARSRNITVRESLLPRGYTSFWDCAETPEPFDGFSSVIPGYDDLLLAREPQMAPVIERHGGRTFRAQFEHAVNRGAHDILIYGWNEYFETVTIEPTREYGMEYVKLCRRMIQWAKQDRQLAAV